MDFDQALPAISRAVGASARAHGVRWRTAPIRASHRFDLVGLPHGPEGLEFRVRSAGGRWSPWTRSSDNDPIWAGGADFVQLRSRDARPRGRLHYVVVPRRAFAHGSQDQGIGTPGTGGRDGPGAQPPPQYEPGGPVPAKPAIVSRAAWGAAGCKPRATPAYGRVQAGLVHHTVTANEYAPEDGPRLVLGICRYHRNGNGWNDIGYNALVDRYGVLYEGRAGGIEQAVVGAQAQGFNSQTTGIASIGTHSSVPLTDPALHSIAGFLSWKLTIHGVPAQGRVTLISGGGRLTPFRAGTRVTINRISGHRDVDSTSCPGGALYGQLELLRSQVKTGTVRVPLVQFQVDPDVLFFPETSVITGQVLASDTGLPLINVPVEIQRLGPKGWKTSQLLYTDGTGHYEGDVSPALDRWLRARVRGLQGYATGYSGRSQLLVRPEVTARFVPGSRFARGRRIVIAGSIRPHKPHLVLAVLRRDRHGRYARVARIPIRARGGSFRVGYRVRRSGSYRLRTVFKNDGRNASARAADLKFNTTADTGGLGTSESGGAGAP